MKTNLIDYQSPVIVEIGCGSEGVLCNSSYEVYGGAGILEDGDSYDLN